MDDDDSINEDVGIDEMPTFVPPVLQSAAKKCDDMVIEHLDTTGAGQHVITISKTALDDIQHARNVFGNSEMSLEEIDTEGRSRSLPFLWARAFDISALGENTPETRPMGLAADVIYLIYLGNTMFMGSLMLCLGTFWMYAFYMLPQAGHYEWVRYTVIGIVWGIFACLYCMLMWIDTKTVRGTAALIIAWQMSAMFAVAALAAFIHHQAPLQVCAIVFLQSIMVVVYTYTQKRDLSASIAFLLMFMVTLLQWAVATFIFEARTTTGRTMVARNQVSSVIVLIVGIAISLYHTFHIRYVSFHNVSHYCLYDKSRLDALRDLYTDGPRWIGVGIRETHWTVARAIRNALFRLSKKCHINS